MMKQPVGGRIGRLVVLCALLGMVGGCGQKGVVKVTVNGVVTYKGKPLSSGIITFNSDKGSYSAATVQANGSFIMTDVIPGEISVGVMEAPQGSGSSSGEASAGPTLPAANLPQKFRDPATSGLKYTVTEKTKDLNIALN